MTALSALLTANGYAANAADAVARTYLGKTPAIARERMTRIAYNYYMQYLVIQLSRYAFDLNRPRIKPDELLHAEALIIGKLGNDPLDNRKLADLLESLINDVLARHHHMSLMTWDDFYRYEFTTPEGIILRGEDMLKAMIKSNALHFGVRAETYHHSFNNIEYKTMTMHHFMARILAEQAASIPGVNTFGVAVKDSDLNRMRKIVSNITTMRDPRFLGFFQQNAHHHIKQRLVMVFKELLGKNTDLYKVYQLHVQLVRDNFNPAMYSPEWQKLLMEMQEGLQLIATPYMGTSQRQSVPAH